MWSLLAVVERLRRGAFPRSNWRLDDVCDRRTGAPETGSRSRCHPRAGRQPRCMDVASVDCSAITRCISGAAAGAPAKRGYLKYLAAADRAVRVAAAFRASGSSRQSIRRRAAGLAGPCVFAQYVCAHFEAGAKSPAWPPAFRRRVVWAAYSVESRSCEAVPTVPSRVLFETALLAAVIHLAVEVTSARHQKPMARQLFCARQSVRSALHSMHGISG